MKYQLTNTNDGFHKGWLTINLLDQSKILVPQGLVVSSIDDSGDTNIYLLSEGMYKGQKSYIQKKYLKEFTEKFEELEIIIHKNESKMYLKDFEFDVVLSDGSEIKNNLLVLVPDFPHKKIPYLYTNEKKSGSKFAETWFNLMIDDGMLRRTNNYFHFGKFSNGCITFVHKDQAQASQWNIVYDLLVKNRIKMGVCASIKVI